jgi:hypothetical protein
MFIVDTGDRSAPWFLRGTTWSRDPERAQKFATYDDARAALEKAKKFMKPATFHAARVVEIAI